MSERSESRVGVGASSILMIVVVLALTAMSLLAFSSAGRTETLVKRNQEMSLGYYAAAAEAQTRLAAMDQKLYDLRTREGMTAEAYGQALLQMTEYGVTQSADGYTFAFAVDAQDSRELCLAGTLSAWEMQGQRYRLTRHELVGYAEGDEQPYYNLMGD